VQCLDGRGPLAATAGPRSAGAPGAHDAGRGASDGGRRIHRSTSIEPFRRGAEPLSELAAALEPYLPALTLAALALALLALLWSLVLSRRLRRLAGGSSRPGVAGGAAADGATGEQERELRALAREVESIVARTDALDTRGRRAVQRFGLVRFNPFEDTGSNQSFALVLLDDEGDGIALSSLHSRHSTRLYAKPILAGRSDTPLSAEESEALRLARAEPARSA
jgi:hypothetical protein